MSIRKFAMVIDGDVFALVSVDESISDFAAGLAAGLSSGPEVVEVTGEEVFGMFNLNQDAFQAPGND